MPYGVSIVLSINKNSEVPKTNELAASLLHLPVFLGEMAFGWIATVLNTYFPKKNMVI